MRALYPDHTMHEYNIPEMHLRNYGPNDGQADGEERIEQVIVQEARPIEVPMPPRIEVHENVTYVRPPPIYKDEDPGPRRTPPRKDAPKLKYWDPEDGMS